MKVLITETLEKIVDVNTCSNKGAIKYVRELYMNQSIVLGSENLSCFEIKVIEYENS